MISFHRAETGGFASSKIVQFARRFDGGREPGYCRLSMREDRVNTLYRFYVGRFPDIAKE
jgi:hypothetical protein